MSYHHFTLRERGKIELMLKQGQKSTAIARELGYNASSVRREIRRNTTHCGYEAVVAQQRYAKRRRACRPQGRLAHEALRRAVIEQIDNLMLLEINENGAVCPPFAFCPVIYTKNFGCFSNGLRLISY